MALLQNRNNISLLLISEIPQNFHKNPLRCWLVLVSSGMELAHEYRHIFIEQKVVCRRAICTTVWSRPCFRYICQKFPGFSIEKLKGRMLDVPDIRKLIQDKSFINHMHGTTLSQSSRSSLVLRVTKYMEVLQNMLEDHRSHGANISIIVHYIHSNLDRLLVNCGEVSDESLERFNHDNKERRSDIRGVGKFGWWQITTGASSVKTQMLTIHLNHRNGSSFQNYQTQY